MDSPFQNILVALDASGAAMVAYEMAETMHRRYGARLSIVHVIERKDEPLDKIQELIAAKKKAGIDIQLLTREGSIYKSIIKAAEDIQADLVVMGTHGIFGFQEFWMGSNAYRVVSGTSCPVMSIQEHFTRNDIKQIVLPIDSSVETRQKVPMAAAIARLFDATIHIFGVSADRDDEAERYIRVYCRQVEEYFEKQGLKFSSNKMLGGNITRNTIDYAVQKEADLIMIMSEQEPNSTAFFMGKFAQQMVNHSPIPVLSIKPRELSKSSDWH